MGSGETAPTMVKVHRAVTDRVHEALGDQKAVGGGTRRGPDRAIGLLLDTPFGFQTNAAELAARAVIYFRESVGATLEVAGMRNYEDLTGDKGHEVIARMVELPLVFAGPGSPSYALRQWRDTLVPSVISEKLALGGAVTFASAAALTLGSATVPVYEVYKVGEDPHWLDGLDLLSALGLPAAVIPHYDNAEGQTHDTRYCYLGEERLRLMEKELEAGTFVLGVDEHTAVMFDFEAASATVVGMGAVTVRVRGSSQRIESGETVSLEQIREIAAGLASRTPLRAPGTGAADRFAADGFAAASGRPQGDGSPLLSAIRAHEASFRAAKARSDAPGMVSAALALEEELWAWRADTLQSDEMDRGRASLRAMIGELGQLSEIGTRNPAELIGPYVDVALSLRDSARRERRFAEADSVRDRLESLGVEIHDTPDGSTWEIRGTTKAS